MPLISQHTGDRSRHVPYTLSPPDAIVASTRALSNQRVLFVFYTGCGIYEYARIQVEAIVTYDPLAWRISDKVQDNFDELLAHYSRDRFCFVTRKL